MNKELLLSGPYVSLVKITSGNVVHYDQCHIDDEKGHEFTNESYIVELTHDENTITIIACSVHLPELVANIVNILDENILQHMQTGNMQGVVEGYRMFRPFITFMQKVPGVLYT